MNNKITTREFLGEKLYENYSDQFPAIRLITYTMDAMSFSKNAVKNSLFAFDMGIDDYDSIYEKIAVIMGIPGYYFRKLLGKNKTNEILISGRLRKLGRYTELQNEFKNDSRVSGVSTFTVPFFLKKIINKSSQINIPCNVYLGYSISGKKLKQYFKQLYVIMESLAKRGLNCETKYDDIADLLEKIRKAKKQRVCEIEKEIKKRKIKLFVTQNQYNLADQLIIEACRKAGIRTAEWQHHQWNLFPIGGKEFIESRNSRTFCDNGNILVYTDELWTWTSADELWIEKNSSIENVYNQNVKISVGGSPEIDRSTIISNKEKYDKKDILTLMVPWNLANNPDYEKRKDILIYEIVNLAKRFNYGVYLKYHPSDEIGRNNGNKYCIGNNVTIVDSSKKGLKKCLCESKIIFGSTSSVMIVAYNYGLRTICVDLYDDNFYDFNSNDFEHIGIDDIKEIDINKSSSNNTGKDSFRYNELVVSSNL